TAAIAVVRGAACRPPPRVPRGGRAPRRGLPRVGYRAMTETPGSMSDLVAVVRRYWPVVVAAVLLVPHALLFDFVNDDAYISFRYARNLAEHGQLVFNVGERVEGFTNFLWTVLLAGGIKLGLSPVLTSRFFGIAFGVRWSYYGWPFPNTFYVKASGGPETWRLGLYYLRRFAEDYGAFFFIPLALLGWPERGDRRRRSLALLAALVWVVFAAYTVSV